MSGKAGVAARANLTLPCGRRLGWSVSMSASPLLRLAEPESVVPAAPGVEAWLLPLLLDSLFWDPWVIPRP